MRRRLDETSSDETETRARPLKAKISKRDRDFIPSVISRPRNGNLREKTRGQTDKRYEIQDIAAVSYKVALLLKRNGYLKYQIH